jgi:uncharacterized phage protein (TIGR01671 family)
MREIKFRGRNYDGIWMYGYLMPTPKPQIHLGNKHCVCACPQKMSRVDVELYEVEESTIGQYTGLKDKNGKEIYEGDIVKENSGRVGYIGFLQQEMGYIIVWRNSDSRLGHRHRGSGYDLDNTIKVIGNIHDNPDLINEKYL